MTVGTPRRGVRPGACFVDERVCMAADLEVMRAFVEECERDCPLGPENVAGALCALDKCSRLHNVDELLGASWRANCQEH